MRILLLVSGILILYACNHVSQKDPETGNNSAVPHTLSDSIYRQVMEGHDKGMIKTGEMIRYTELLQKKADSLASLKAPDTSYALSVKTTLQELKAAQELMNKWMGEFNPDAAGETEVQKIAFYQKEKEKVDTVTARIFSSLAAAKQLAGE